MAGAVNNYASNASGLSSPAVDGVAITPDDANDLIKVVRGIHVGGAAGTVTIVTPKGTTLALYGAQGQTLPFMAARVKSTGTAATGLIGVY